MTSGVDALLTLFAALSADERRDALEQLNSRSATEQAGEEGTTAAFIRSLRRVAERLGREPSVDDYKYARELLVAEGEDIKSINQVIRHFGSWRRAKEALALSEHTTARRIEERFAERRVGKTWKYTVQTLSETLVRVVEHYGRAPTVAEFEWWREREMQTARARGDISYELPSSSPFRKRWGSWEGALTANGIEPELIAARHEGSAAPANRNADPYLPKGLPVARMRSDRAQSSLAGPQLWRLKQAWTRLPRRSQHVLTVRLALGGVKEHTLKETAGPLCVHLDYVRQLQLIALDELAAAVSEDGEVTPKLREAVVDTLRQMSHIRVRRPTG